jgi:hypothetical protein
LTRCGRHRSKRIALQDSLFRSPRKGLNRHSSAYDQWIVSGCVMQHQRNEETSMNTSARMRSMRRGKAATLLIASALAMGLSSVPAQAGCPKGGYAACVSLYWYWGGGAAAAYCAAMCVAVQDFDTSGQGSPSENLGTSKQPGKKGPVVGYGSDPSKGFGDYTPVTLPPDRRPPPGTSTGIPVTRTPSNVLTNAQPQYFRPR